MANNEIDLTADLIDVSELTERAEELEAEIAGKLGVEAGELGSMDLGAIAEDSIIVEAETLRDLLEELRGNGGGHKWRGDWYPEMLIRDSYFEAYMDEMLEDIGDLPKNLPCYLTVTVDYDALKMDYTGVDIDGIEYLYR